MLSRWSVGKLGKLGHVYSDVWRRSTGPEENLHKPGSSIWWSCLPRKSRLLTRLQHSTMSEWVIDRLTNHRKVQNLDENVLFCYVYFRTFSVDGNWATWGSWKTCSVTCGGGIQHRDRTCTSPAPAHSGAPCAGNSTSSQDCNTQICISTTFYRPLNLHISILVYPNLGGHYSTLSTLHKGLLKLNEDPLRLSLKKKWINAKGILPCLLIARTALCLVDGAWTDWSQWGSCTKTCGGGRRSRSRTCDNPKPANGGKECFGDSGDFGDCNVDDCPTVAAGTYQQVRPSLYLKPFFEKRVDFITSSIQSFWVNLFLNRLLWTT